MNDLQAAFNDLEKLRKKQMKIANNELSSTEDVTEAIKNVEKIIETQAKIVSVTNSHKEAIDKLNQDNDLKEAELSHKKAKDEKELKIKKADNIWNRFLKGLGITASASVGLLAAGFEHTGKFGLSATRDFVKHSLGNLFNKN